MTRYRYVTCDVFTDSAFSGNPLAVVLDARGLDSDRMLTIAREFNLSETSFVLPPTDPRNTAQVRIFTPGGELPFAGHPTIGTAFALATLGMIDVESDSIVFEEGIGPVPVKIERDTGRTRVRRCTLTAPQAPRKVADGPGREAVASMLNLKPSELIGTTKAWSCGVPFLVVPVTLDALPRALLDLARWRELLPGSITQKVYPVAQVDQSTWRVRMFAPGMGIAEDPATGSAAAAFAGWLTQFEERNDGTGRWTILQGQEIGRPSRIELEAEIEQGTVRVVRVGGAAVMISEGELSA